MGIYGNQTIASLNPFRYRGYYYDAETGYYYLNSRYYNAEWGRFVNADTYVSTGRNFVGCDMFAYCLNNPVNNYDPTGQVAVVDDVIIVVAILIVGLLAVETVGVTGVTYYNTTTFPSTNSTGIDRPFEYPSDPFALSKTKDYNPDPYGRAGQKKQGRETKAKARKKGNYKPRNNRRDNKPRLPKSHTPGRDHQKFSQKSIIPYTVRNIDSNYYRNNPAPYTVRNIDDNYL